jgi:hypothetical protein
MNTKNVVDQVRSGDIFIIPLGDGRAYVGQVLTSKAGALYVIVFDEQVAVDAELHFRKTPDDDPLFATLTFDGRFRPGMWRIIGNSNPDLDRYLPAFSYGSAETNGFKITDFWDKVHRDATPEEAAMVPHRLTRAPVRLEKAVLAHAGILPWKSDYDDLKYAKYPTSAELFGH